MYFGKLNSFESTISLSEFFLIKFVTAHIINVNIISLVVFTQIHLVAALPKTQVEFNHNVTRSDFIVQQFAGARHELILQLLEIYLLESF